MIISAQILLDVPSQSMEIHAMNVICIIAWICHNCIDKTKVINEEKMYYYKWNRTNEEGNKCEKCINGYSLNEKGLCANDKGCKEKEEN